MLSNICPVCSCNRVKKKAGYSNILALPLNTDSRVYECNSCKALYLYPSVDPKKLYEESYFLSNQLADSSIPSTGLDYESEIVPYRHEKFNATIEELLSMKPDAKNILDIGAATGDFLNVAKTHNLDVYGLEISDYAVERARERFGIEIYRTQLEDFDTVEKFDLIHINHVLEHFRSPTIAIEKIARLISDTGVVFVEVPYQFNYVERLQYKILGKTNRFSVSSLHHPFFFRPDSLCSYFANSGFSTLKLSCFNPRNYPVKSLKQKVKLLVWKFLSSLNQGLIIEAFFQKMSENQ